MPQPPHKVPKSYTPPPNPYATGPIVWHPTTVYEVARHVPAGQKPADYMKAPMTIDTGAWQSTIPKSMGTALGYKQHPGERVYHYYTSIGPTPYLLREMDLKIAGHKPVTIPVSWAQTEQVSTGAAIGRKGVLDHFDIFFSEANNKMDFKARDGVWK